MYLIFRSRPGNSGHNYEFGFKQRQTCLNCVKNNLKFIQILKTPHNSKSFINQLLSPLLIFSPYPAMTERSNFGYPPMNMIYPPQQTQQWNANTQQYIQGEYYTQDAIYSSATRPAIHPPPASAQYAAAYQSASRSPQQIYAHPPPQPQQIRPISQADMHQYVAPSASPPSHMVTTASRSPTQYHPQMAGYPQPLSMQYPASPNRPFSCDMCALSFNRQHDLKRHRETHSGEKPFLCNGGCGKMFTRKDALKRHQVSNEQTL